MARFDPIHVHSKSGKQLTLRSPSEADAVALLEYGVMAHSETMFMVTLPEEFKLTLQDEFTWITRMETAANSIAILAEYGGKIIGMIDFHGNETRKRILHAGTFGMAVFPEFRNDGIGALLIQALLDWATPHATIKKLGLAVFATNARAIHLYKKMGFEEEGRRVRHVELEPDHFIDDILMFKWIQK